MIHRRVRESELNGCHGVVQRRNVLSREVIQQKYVEEAGCGAIYSLTQARMDGKGMEIERKA